mmetsp:Transcript_32044/g.79819  ORF Transcript_32044/g.79819 Transcript_32044/m.79819 type:complete len:207 (-) Transcript_32044:94-714(-)
MTFSRSVHVVQDVVPLVADDTAHEERGGEPRLGEGARVPVRALLVDERGRHVLPRVQRAPLAFDEQLQHVVPWPPGDDAELPLGEGLRRVDAERHRCDAVDPREAHVHEELSRLELHLERHVRERRVRAVRVVRLAPAHAAEERRHVEAYLLEHLSQQRVLLEAVASPPAVDEFADDVRNLHGDGAAQHDVAVLERDRRRVCGHQA